MIQLNKQNKNKISIFYDITLACNNRCNYCYQLPNLDNKLKFNFEVFEKFKEQFNKIPRNSLVELQILGGDPLFVNEIIKINELNLENVDLIIFSNANYKPKVFREKIERLSNINFKIYLSFHESSNIKNVMKNLLYLVKINKLDMISFMVDNYNFKKYEKIINKIHSKNINVCVSPIRKDNFYEINDEIHLFIKKINYNDLVLINDKEINVKALDIELDKVSFNFLTKCKLSVFKVTFDGKIIAACEYNYVADISKDEFKCLDVVCTNKTCYCDTTTYKQLIKPKNNDEHILKFFKDYNE